MKKRLFFGLVAILGLIGCSRNQEIDVPDANLSLFARTESPAETKTVVESGVHVFWEPGDEIAVFMGEQSAKFTTDITATSGTATFKGTFGDATWPEDIDLWAVYPFSEDAVFDGETITTTLPSEQVAREGSFGKDMNLAIAHSNSSTLQFYNVGGGIRFSVTEEGIKKVMFEGLSGEIISGKVKIGFEGGLPVVKEITGGSQFITILPPTGQETFEPGVWYYIVAIPGSLEGGYKLRFYKDTEYARKVSEKKVEIKRSVFGNVEKADEGIEYEPQMTHFPETKEEMIESNQIALDITSSISHLVQDDENPDPQELAKNLLAIDGVLEAELNEDESAFIIKQKDNTYINYLLKYDRSGYPISASGANSASTTRTPIIKSKNVYKSSIVNQEGMVIPSNKSAILIVPFHTSDDSDGAVQGGFGVNDSFIKDALITADYSLETPVTDKDATLDKFDINNLSKYGIVIIRTHGVANAKTNHGEISTALVTHEKIEDESFLEYLLPDRWGKLSRCIINDNQIYYCSTVPWMEDCATSSTQFKNSLVFAGDCQGMMNDDLRNCFFKYGAAACCGFSDIVAHGTANFAMHRFFNLLASGTGVIYASTNAVYSEDAIAYQEYCETNTGITDGTQLRTLFRSYLNPELNNQDLYLNDLSPKSLKCKPNGQFVTFEWQSDQVRNLDLTEIDNYEKGFKLPYLKLELRYSVFIDGKNVARDITANSFTKDGLEVGKQHSWYVISKVMYDGEICDTFRTDGEDFTVKVQYAIPQAIDLGLPSGTKWASFNLGASKPEEVGDRFAWGETDTKSDYSWESYKWCKGTKTSLTKYCWDGEYGFNGFVDNKTELELSDDAAFMISEGRFRTPSAEEFLELFEECWWEWVTDYNGTGVKGYRVTNIKDGYIGESIFLPSTAVNGCGNYLSVSGGLPASTTGYFTLHFEPNGGPMINGIYNGIWAGRASVGSKADGNPIRPVCD